MSNSHDNLRLCCGRPQPTEPWGPTGGRRRRDQVEYSQRGGGFAFRPGHFHCRDRSHTVAALNYLIDAGVLELERLEDDDSLEGVDDELVSAVGFLEPPDPIEYLIILPDDTVVDVEYHLDEMNDRGIGAEPNYVLFADGVPSGGCGCGFGASPVFGSPVFGSPVFGSPVFGSPVFGSPVYGSGNAGGGQFAMSAYASPVYGSPVFGSPVFGSPVFGSGYKSDGLRSNTARPAAGPTLVHTIGTSQTKRTVVVLDTGMAAPVWQPGLLQGRLGDECGGSVYDPPDQNGDHYYDPASGHGTFIAGLVEQLAPQQHLIVRRVLSSFGDGDIARDIVPMINCVRHAIKDAEIGPETVVNMSFSGYADREMCSLARAVRRLRRTGAVVVASAGNDATCRPTFPACLPGVVGVGALDEDGPAAFTNHGSWVRACAPGTDLVSSFYAPNQNAPALPGELSVPPLPGSGDPAQFEGWARWSGTSFSAPIVTAALVRHMVLSDGDSANEAVDALIDAPGLYRIPGLGAVVNVSPLA